MSIRPIPELPNEALAQLHEELRSFETDAVLSAWQEAVLDLDLWERAKSDPRAFFQARGIDVSRGFEIVFEDRPVPPGPDNPPEIDWKRWGIVGWRCIRYCSAASDDIQPHIMRCEDICLPLFARRF